MTENAVTHDLPDGLLKAYVAAYMTLRSGFGSFYAAESAYSRLMLTYFGLRIQQSEGRTLHASIPEVFPHLVQLTDDRVREFEYVSNISHLIYATTLLDTFLSETTVLLFLQFPTAMGRSQQIPLKTLIEAKSIYAALTDAAVTRAREISYRSFEDRLAFLRESFGLDFALDDETTELLRRYSEMRNLAVHDQGFFAFGLDDAGVICFSRKHDSGRSTQISGEHPGDAAATYHRICNAVAEAVLSQVLKRPAAEIGEILCPAPVPKSQEPTRHVHRSSGPTGSGMLPE